MRRRWRWQRLLLIPALASVHACDCGSCLDLGPSSCAFDEDTCGIGGQCSTGGACPGNLLLDTTTSCGDAGGFCCGPPLPPCAQIGGTCQGGSYCASGSLMGDCGDSGVCCTAIAEDSPSDAEPMGSCNGEPCASGCDCEPSGSDAGGGVCQCAEADSGPDAALDAALDAAPDADAGVDGQEPDDAEEDTETKDGASADTDGPLEASASSDATVDGEAGDAAEQDAANDADAAEDDTDAASSCGVILCGTRCTCLSQAMSACVCP
jgi:hypothetical protein